MVKRVEIKLDPVGMKLLTAVIELAKGDIEKINHAVLQVTMSQPRGTKGYFRRQLPRFARAILLSKTQKPKVAKDKGESSSKQVSYPSYQKARKTIVRQGELF